MESLYGKKLMFLDKTVDSDQGRTRPRMTRIAPPINARAPIPIEGSISGAPPPPPSGMPANAGYVATKVITSTAKNWRKNFIGYFSIFLYSTYICKNPILHCARMLVGVLL
jgi:hypothetical protein